MGAFPVSPRSEFLAWCASHATVWSNEETNIGLTEMQATAFQSAVTAAQNAVASQQTAKDAAKAATSIADGQVAALRAQLNETLRIIRTFAVTNNLPNVYNLAQIPPPATPSPVPPPAKPGNITVGLITTTGAIQLKWKASNPPGASGTSYIVRRRVSSADPWTFVGVTGSKTFVDDAFDAGPDTVQYTIQGQRSGSSGPISDIVVINFGRAPGGGGFSVTTVENTEGDDVRLAA